MRRHRWSSLRPCELPAGCNQNEATSPGGLPNSKRECSSDECDISGRLWDCCDHLERRRCPRHVSRTGSNAAGICAYVGRVFDRVQQVTSFLPDKDWWAWHCHRTREALLMTFPDNWFLANVYASLSGGACSTLATNPIWVIKTRLMAQSKTTSTANHSRPPWQYRNTLDAARKMYRAEGLLSFYSGLTPAMLGLTHVAIQFPLYEVFKEKFTGIGAGMNETDEDRSHHFYGLAVAVFLSKVCASTATYPHEVVRTRLQTQQRTCADSSPNTPDNNPPPGSATSKKRHINVPYRGTIQTCKTILLEEGWRGFYAGLGTNLIRAVPSAMTTILTFEYMKKTMSNLRREGQEDFGVSGESTG